MGLHIHPGTMPGGVTPICNKCGVALCYDIAAEEAEEAQEFWDAWVCRDCNGGQPMSLKAFQARSQARPR
jgi:hypothetical protein